MYKCKRILEKCSLPILFVGFLILFGAVGAMETETISMSTGIIRSIIGMTLMFIGGKLS